MEYPEVSLSRLQVGLNLTGEWMRENRLQLNANKTSLHVFRPARGKHINFCPSSLCLNGEQLQVASTSLKWLGVDIDEKLTFDDFIRAKCQSACSEIRTIRFLGNALDRHARNLLIHSLVISRLLYCDSLLVAVSESRIQRVQRVWNWAAKVVTGDQKYDHVTPVMKELGWISARQKALVKIAKLVFLSLNGLAPQYLKVDEQTRIRDLRSVADNAVLLRRVVPRGLVESGRWEVIAGDVWNRLPPALRVVGGLRLGKFLDGVTQTVI